MEFQIQKDVASIIKVIGVGGGGGNAVNHMFSQGIRGVDLLFVIRIYKRLKFLQYLLKFNWGHL